MRLICKESDLAEGVEGLREYGYTERDEGMCGVA